MTKTEIANKYGVTLRTINRWMTLKGMPYNKNELNKTLYFDEKEVEEWMKSMWTVQNRGVRD